MSWVGFRRAGPIAVAVLRLHRLLPKCERLYAKGRYAEVARLAEKACGIARRQFGEVDRNVADALSWLGLAELSMGDPAAAERRFRRMLEIRQALFGEVDGEVGVALNYLGSSRRAQGDLPEAEELYRRSLAIVEADPRTPATARATVRRTVGEICIEGGKYGEGEALVQSSYDTLVGILGEDHPELVDTARSLAGVHLVCSRLEEAERLLRWCLKSQQRRGLERTPGFASDLFSLGLVLRGRGRLAEAADLQEKALEILGRDHAMYGTGLVQLASTRLAAGDQEAEALCDRALDVIRAAGRPGLAAALREKARFREAWGDLAAAEDLYREAVSAGSTLDRIEALLGLSKLLMARAEFNRAETCVRDATRKSWESLGSGHPRTANCLQALSVFYEFTGSLPTAEALSEQVLETLRSAFGPTHLAVGEALDRLAYLRLQTQGVEAARPLLEEAGAIFAASLGEDHPALVQHLEHRAQLLRFSGDLPAAEALYRHCLRLRARTEGPRSLEFATTLAHLALLRLPRGDSPGSERMFRYSLEVIRSLFGDDSPLLLIVLRDLAFAYAAAGRIADAMATLDETAAVDERLMGRIFALGVEGQRTAFIRDVRGSLEVRLSLVLRHASDSPRQIAKTFEAVLRRKAFGAAAEAVRRDAVLGGRYPELAPRLKELSQVQARIAAKVLAGPLGEDLAAYLCALTELSARSAQLESDLGLQIPEMSLEVELRTAGRHGVAARLAEGAALVELVRFREVDFAASAAAVRPCFLAARYLAFVLLSGRGDGVEMIDLGDAGRIDRLVARLTLALTHGSAGRELDEEDPDGAERERASEIARELREAVFAPLLPALAGCRELVIAPDGDLARLSFDVLPGAESGYLIDEHRIRYVTSGRDLLRAGRRPLRQTASVVIADPDFDAGSTEAGAPEPDPPPSLPEPLLRGASRFKKMHFRRLEGMRAEGEAVARMLGVEPWLGDGAREGRLKKVESPEVLHLATHGFFFESDDWESSPFAWGVADRKDLRWVPDYTFLLSGLALAGINSFLEGVATPDPEEDGLLNAMDVAALDLLDTELVVLSACETGLGKVHVGEGVLGLRRAFVTAGARTLVASLWKVPDEPTRDLMVDFYRRLLAGEGRAEALRQAKLASRERFADPAWWGAFICQGEDGPLRPRAAPAAGEGSGEAG